jgi:hypothetical protein
MKKGKKLKYHITSCEKGVREDPDGVEFREKPKKKKEN